MSVAGHPRSPRIAIIGLACQYPGAPTPRRLWENILARRAEFRRMPDSRLPLAEYQDDDKSAPDKMYVRRAAVLHDFEFDWRARRIPKPTFEATDIAHWLALETALEALNDAGYTKSQLPRERTCVMVGNSLTGEQQRTSLLRLRWPYVEKTLRRAAEREGVTGEAFDALSQSFEEEFKAPFVAVNEDSLAGALSNTIAGRICNYLDVQGGGYVVDGACASSILSVVTAANALTYGDADFALAGGVDISLDPFEMVGFSKVGALTTDDIRVYDHRASGFLPGEGCGFIAMKRLDDAVRDGDRVYAVLNGWGVSSDGAGGITQPSARGQRFSLLRAYERAGYSPSTLAFVEGHGTATPVGDPIELEAIATAMEHYGDTHPRQTGVTSLKSIVGHCKAAAGIGGIIKAVMAVNRRVIPPTRNVEKPSPAFNSIAKSLYPVRFGRRVGLSEPMRAGVSAMGFGGVNAHVTIESAGLPSTKLQPSIDERALMASWQRFELFVLSGNTIEELSAHAHDAALRAEGLSAGELPDFALELAQQSHATGGVRAAIAAESVDDLIRRLHGLPAVAAKMNGTIAMSDDGRSIVGAATSRARVGVLFPGQGSQRIHMARMLVERFDWARDFVARAERVLHEEGADGVTELMFRNTDLAVDEAEVESWESQLTETSTAQPAICIASVLWWQWLRRLGVSPSAVGGHSLGELVAAYAAGAIDDMTLVRLGAVRGRLMGSVDGDGTMAGLACDSATAEQLIEGETTVVVANRNSPVQTVISGEREAILRMLDKARAQDISGRLLKVGGAFHSPLVGSAATALAQTTWIPTTVAFSDSTFISAVTGQPLRHCEDLRAYLSEQLLAPVDFVGLVRSMEQHVDVVLEVGPGATLSRLWGASSRVPATSVEARPGDDISMCTTVGMLFVSGATVDVAGLFSGRLVRKLKTDAERLYIRNPCEITPDSAAYRRPVRAPNVVSLPSVENASHARLASEAPAPVAAAASGGAVFDLLSTLVQQRTGFPPEAIRGDLRMLQDLNLDSIKGMDIISTLASRAGVTTEIDVSVLLPLSLAAIAEAIADNSSAQIVATPIERSVVAPSINQTKVAAPLALSKVVDDAITYVAVPRAHAANDQPQVVLETLFELVAHRTGFPRASIDVNQRLLQDLNLDSIKGMDIISTVASRVGVTTELDVSVLLPLPLGAIASAIAEHAPHGASAPASASARASASVTSIAPRREVAALVTTSQSSREPWVRAFGMNLNHSPLPVSDDGAWSGKQVAVHVQGIEPDWSEGFCKSLEVAGAQVSLAPTSSSAEIFIVCVGLDDRRGDVADLERIVTFIANMVRMASASASARTASKESPLTLCIVRRMDGASDGLLDIGLSSLAATLHLENPTLRVRSVEFDPRVDAATAVEALARECAVDATSVASVYDTYGRRSVATPLVIQTSALPPRESAIGKGDVVVVTGGARGITAECALGLARETKCITVLLGRSPHPSVEPDRTSSHEVSTTLRRFATEGLEARYLSCDVSDATQVRETIKRVRDAFGRIDAIVHGAGANVPRRAEAVTAATALDEIAPKVRGILNLLDAVEDQVPARIVALTSIIGTSGMPGNAWYAFSNQTLDRTLGRFQAKHPECDVVCIGFSVWGEVGMGARLGAVEHLARQGTVAIPVASGVRYFIEAVQRALPTREAIVTSRLGGIDTWTMPSPELPAAHRFIDDVRSVVPGVEAISRTRLTVTDDKFVADHCFDGTYLFPAVFGIEAMGQLAAYALGRTSFEAATIENFVASRPIIVPSEVGCLIEVRAEVLQDDPRGVVVRAGICTEISGFTREHFSCEIIVPAHALADAPQFNISVPASPTPLEPKRDLYGPFLFQGELFQRIRRVHSLDANVIVYDSYRESMRTSGFVLGDPYARDSFLHAPTLCTIPQEGLPTRIDRIEILGTESATATLCLCKTTVTRFDGRFVTECVATDGSGRVVERIAGYEAKAVRERDWPTAEQLAKGITSLPVHESYIRELGSAPSQTSSDSFSLIKSS